MDKSDVERVVTEAMDFGQVTDSEHEALVDFLNLSDVDFDPVAKTALARYLGVLPKDGNDYLEQKIPRSYVHNRNYIWQLFCYLLRKPYELSGLLTSLILYHLFIVVMIEIPRQAFEYLNNLTVVPSIVSNFGYDTSVVSYNIIVLITIWLFALLLSNLFYLWYEISQKNIGEHIANQLRKDAFESLLKKPITEIGEVNMGTIASKLIINPDAANRFINDFGLKVVSDIFLIAIMTIYLGMLNKTIFLAACIFFPVLAFSAIMIGRKTRGLSNKLNDAKEEINTEIKDSLAARREIRTNATEHLELGRFHERIKNVESTTRRYHYFIGITNRLLAGSTEFITIIAFGVGAVSVSQGSTNTATLIAFLLALPQVLLRFTRLALAVEPYQINIVPLRNLLDLVNWRTNKETNLNSHQENPFGNEKTNTPLVLQNCNFHYPRRNFHVNYGNLKIDSGKLVAIVGDSGAGKSTLFMLLTKVLPQYEGSILINEKELLDWGRNNLVKKVRVMGQDSFLFNRTIRENLLYGTEDLKISESRIEEICKSVQIHNDIVHSLGGYAAKIVNHGDNLSGGQKRRLTLARAIMSDPKVLLLDEPFTGVPSNIVKELTNTIKSIARNRVILLITHNPGVAIEADHILVFQRTRNVDGGRIGGRIISQGKHQHLIQSCDFYRQIALNHV